MDILEKSVKNMRFKFHCDFCDYHTSKKTDYDRHLLTAYHEKCTKNVQKMRIDFRCEKCDYHTSRKYDYERHLLTAYHEKYKNNELSRKLFRCEHCSYETFKKHHYEKHLSSNKHKKNIDIENSNFINKELFYSLMKDNQDFKNMILKQNENTEELHNIIIEQNKQMIELSYKANSIITTNNNNNNTINNTINNNQKFNLNFFLNEQCKDAMNLSDFIDSIDVSFKDLEYVGEHGYINGITKIIMDNLNQLDIYKRPIHCTDIKREIIHIKNNNIWEKDTEDNEKMKKFIASVGRKNSVLVHPWQLQNPECEILDSPKYNQWLRLAMRSNEYSKEIKNHEAILRNICKKIYLDKKELQNI
jgi:hypothetical protein